MDNNTFKYSFISLFSYLLYKKENKFSNYFILFFVYLDLYYLFRFLIFFSIISLFFRKNKSTRFSTLENFFKKKLF